MEVDNAGTEGVPNVVFNYQYDAVDNLVSVTDTIDGVVSGVETFTYDELNRVTTITQSGNGVAEKRVDMAYDPASQMTSLTRYSDLAGTQLVADSSYEYDDFGRLINLTDSQGNVTLAAYNWVYDEANRITSFISPDGTANYDYDDLDQIVGADYDYQENESYSYDDNGNRTNSGYVTGVNNQLLSDGTYNYEYDGEGNRVKRTEIATGEVTEYEWDYRNRLIGVVVTDSSGNVIKEVEYTYDVFNRRIAKSVDADGDGIGEAIVERFVHDEDHIALTFDGDGNVSERLLHGAEIDQILAQENVGGEVNWALADHQGSIRFVLDSVGNIVNQITYDAFGNVTLESDSSVEFRFGYTGRELDEETGLDYYGSRYRDGAVGRFIGEDPIGFSAGDVNLSRYVFNSPLNYTDSNGNIAIPLIPVAAAAVTLVGIWYYNNQLQRQLDRLIDSPYVPPTAENTDEEPKAPPPNPSPKPVPVPIPEPSNPDPNKEECDDECLFDIDEEHIFYPVVYSNRLSGFHHAASDGSTAIEGIHFEWTTTTPSNADDFPFSAEYTIPQNRTLTKTSSFFPRDLLSSSVLEIISDAYVKTCVPNGWWTGVGIDSFTSVTFPVEGYAKPNGKINIIKTAYPGGLPNDRDIF